MLNCWDCKFWLVDGDTILSKDDAMAPHRRCSRIKHGNSEIRHFIDDDKFTEPAVVLDGDDYKAELWTTGDFGCAVGEES